MLGWGLHHPSGVIPPEQDISKLVAMLTHLRERVPCS